MEVQKQRVENKTRNSSVSMGVNVVDATFQHLIVLRILIEGLASSEAEGFWLKNLHGIPVVPRISPLDLVYLDKDQRVLEAVELLPVGEFPAFRAPAVTALVLPFQSLKRSGTAVGDCLILGPVEAAAADPAPTVAEAPLRQPAVAAPVVLPEPAIMEADPVLVSAAEQAEPVKPLQHETEPARPGLRQRKHRGARMRASKGKQLAARHKDNFYRHTPFIVEAAPAAPHAQREDESKARPAEPAARQLQVPAPAAKAKSAKAAKVEKPSSIAAAQNEKRPAEKKSVLERVLGWLSPNTYSEERRTSIRRPAQGLVAYSAHDGKPRKFEVGDISSTGIYLRTDEAWEPGATVELTLQRMGPMEQRRDRRMDVQAGAVRRGNDGVGLMFDLPEGMHLDLWECAARGKTYETGPEYIVHEMRTARALGTIRRICPAASDEIKRMLDKEFSNVRVASAVRIAYIAEEMLTREASAEARLAPVDQVRSILDTGSWADTDWILEMWGGLLATSCSSDGEDESNAAFIDMLGQLTPVHLRILGLLSERAAKPGPVTGPFTVNCCTAAELTKALDLSNLTKTLRTVQELADMGLLAAAKRSPSEPQDEKAKTAITPLGLEMIARCRGQRPDGALEKPAVAAAKEPARLGVSYSANAG